MIFGIIMICLILGIFGLMIIDKHSDNIWFCNFWGWHHPGDDDFVGFNGCSLTSKCRRCRKDILTDSNGDWF
jgi:hypothetical protein